MAGNDAQGRQTVGFLTSPENELVFARYFRVNPDILKNNVSVIVFSLNNTDAGQNTVFGTMVADGKTAAAKLALPRLILNFSVPNSRQDEKTLDALTEKEELTVLNCANYFDRRALMQMLLSDERTEKYVLPFADIKGEAELFYKTPGANLIIEPLFGADIKKIVYCRQKDFGYDIYSSNALIYKNAWDIERVLMPAIRYGGWICLDTPQLLIYGGGLMIVRAYLRRNADGEWKTAQTTIVSGGEQTLKNQGAKLDAEMIKMINRINCFISDLAFCTLDCALDKLWRPYFLSLGGWQDIEPQKVQHRMLFDSVCRSISEYSSGNTSGNSKLSIQA